MYHRHWGGWGDRCSLGGHWGCWSHEQRAAWERWKSVSVVLNQPKAGSEVWKCGMVKGEYQQRQTRRSAPVMLFSSTFELEKRRLHSSTSPVWTVHYWIWFPAAPTRLSPGDPPVFCQTIKPSPFTLGRPFPSASSLMNVTFHLKLPCRLSAQLFPNSP